MARIAEYELIGNRYPLIMSAPVLEEMEERLGGIEQLDARFSAQKISKTLGEICWLLSVMMKGGADFIRLTRQEERPILTEQELRILLGVQDVQGAVRAILRAVSDSAEREIELEAEKIEKKEKTTQSE